MKNNRLYIYTDGSWSPKTKEGGWAFLLSEEFETTTEKSIFFKDLGYAPKTTGNRMELSAVLNSIKYSVSKTEYKELVVYTDSQYVSDSIYYNRISEWRANNWMRREWNSDEMIETANRDLWEELDALLTKLKREGYTIDICWVKGHNKSFLNKVADRFAVLARALKKPNEQYDTTVENLKKLPVLESLYLTLMKKRLLIKKRSA